MKMSNDLLALQARVRQLEEALMIFNPLVPSSMSEGFRARAKCFNTPAPDVSPLWVVLKVALDYCQHRTSPAIINLGNNVAALTPELRALIAEMSGRGE